MRIDIVTLFPELCDGFLSTSILGRARAKNLFEAHCHQIRDYTKNKQRQTDDYPYGGGCGMVLYAQPIADCLRAVADQCAQQGRAKPHVVFLTAAGQPYNEETARRLSSYESLALVCGHYEGIDQRVIDTFGDEEISIGDYVLTGGELASLVVADSVLRLQPGVLAEEKGYQDESYWDGLLEYPQFTRPEVWEGQAIPPVLLTGDHNKIDAWRGRQSRERTRQRRPDLYDQWCATHPITQIPRWKRTERAQLIKTDAQLDAAAKLFAEGCRTVCRDVCTEAGLAEYTPDMLVGNLKFLNSLSDEELAVFKEAARLSTEEELSCWDDQVEEAKQIAENDMGVTFIDVDISEFSNKVSNVQQEMLDANPDIQDLYDHIQAINAEYEEGSAQ